MRVEDNILRQESPVFHKISYASATKRAGERRLSRAAALPFFWRGCMRIELIRQVLSLPQTVLKTAGHTSTHPPPWKSYSYRRRPGRRRSPSRLVRPVPVKTFQHQQRAVARGAEEVAEGRERERLVVGKISAHERAGAHIDLAVQASRGASAISSPPVSRLSSTRSARRGPLRQSGRARGPVRLGTQVRRAVKRQRSARKAVWRLV